MKLIQLNTVQKTSQNYLKYFAIVDDDDYDFLIQWKWTSHKMGETIYADRFDTVTKKTILMHRIIMKDANNLLIDHKDRNGLNNQKSNLRIATRSQNNANRKRTNKGTSIYLGVMLEKRGWTARIRKDGKGKRLGTFLTEKDAAIAYNNAAIKFHGEFANLNKI